MKLLIVDDHPVVLEGLTNVMKQEGYDVLKAIDAKEAMEIASQNPDIGIFIVDLALKADADGLSLISELKSLSGGAPAIVYTMHGEAWNLRMLMDAGVEGIVLKGDSISELIDAVKAVERGETFRSSEFEERYNAISNAQGIMSKRELEVLRLIGDGVNSKEIAENLCLTEKAVEYHRSNILKKLGSTNMAQAINQAVKLGILTCIAALATFNAAAEVETPEAIDLGLSVKWADRNLGAPSPIEEGGYFAFGEVEEKDYYSWDTYQYCYNGNMFSMVDFGVESLCGTQYDAAHVILGGYWRLPNDEEIEELIENTTREYFIVEPMSYVRVTGPSGAYIDIPFTGTKSFDKVNYKNKDAAMWSGSFYVEEGEEDGFYYYMNGPFFLAGDCKEEILLLLEGNPYLGLQIRPVYEEGTSVASLESAPKTLEAIYSIDGRQMQAEASSLPSGIYIYRYSDGTSQRRLMK